MRLLSALTVLSIYAALCLSLPEGVEGNENYVVLNFGSGFSARNLRARVNFKHKEAQKDKPTPGPAPSFDVADFRPFTYSHKPGTAASKARKDQVWPGEAVLWDEIEPLWKEAKDADEGRKLWQSPDTPAGTVIYWSDPGAGFGVLFAGEKASDGTDLGPSDYDKLEEVEAEAKDRAFGKLKSAGKFHYAIGEVDTTPKTIVADVDSVEKLSNILKERQEKALNALTWNSRIFIIGHHNAKKDSTQVYTDEITTLQNGKSTATRVYNSATELAELIAGRVKRQPRPTDAVPLKVSVIACNSAIGSNGKAAVDSFSGRLSQELAKQGVLARVSGRTGKVQRAEEGALTRLKVYLDHDDKLGNRYRAKGSKVFFTTDPSTPTQPKMDIREYWLDPNVRIFQVTKKSEAEKIVKESKTLGTIAFFPNADGSQITFMMRRVSSSNAARDVSVNTAETTVSKAEWDDILGGLISENPAYAIDTQAAPGNNDGKRGGQGAALQPKK